MITRASTRVVSERRQCRDTGPVLPAPRHEDEDGRALPAGTASQKLHVDRRHVAGVEPGVRGRRFPPAHGAVRGFAL